MTLPILPQPTVPLRKAEPNLFPPDLLDQPASPGALGDRQWWAVYTLSRQEKALMRHLQAHKIAYFSPIIAHQYRSPSARRRTSYRPMFANYVFVRGTRDDRITTFASNRVSKCIEIPDPEQLVTQLRSIQRLITAGRPMTLESRLRPGTPVRIRSGALAGVEGVITERRGDHRLLVAVTLIQRGVSVSLEDWDIERM